MGDEKLLERIEDSVCRFEKGLEMELLPAALDSAPAKEILQALNMGIEKARRLFKKGEYALPDFLLAIDTYRAGVNFFKNRVADADKAARRVVIGVVEGDVHDMGKNIVAAVLEACGFQVTDLGKNIPGDQFLETIRSARPDILALSTMMSTTLEGMKDIIEQVKRDFPETMILVGGAPFDPDLARRIGADGYAENVITIPDETKRVLTVAREKKLLKDTGP
ncbi:MAG: hypothetical protein B5M56_06585 [Desulfococcus sp. 4484_241]|nr:MAG: hypothetical protein B5M56_06585 [Desulfococcus sp. 4484_241]